MDFVESGDIEPDLAREHVALNVRDDALGDVVEDVLLAEAVAARRKATTPTMASGMIEQHPRVVVEE